MYVQGDFEEMKKRYKQLLSYIKVHAFYLLFVCVCLCVKIFIHAVCILYAKGI